MIEFLVKCFFGGALIASAYSEQVLRDGKTEHGAAVVTAVTEDPDNLGYELVRVKVEVPDTIPAWVMESA